MFADVLVSYDDDGQEVEEPAEEALVRTRIMELDGAMRSLVTLYGGDGGHLAVGGDSDSGLVVYATRDNETFFQLTRDVPGDEPQVTVVAGGQPGEYPANQVVNVDAAITAAQAYAGSGALHKELSWLET